jgi:hypothetical protein
MSVLGVLPRHLIEQDLIECLLIRPERLGDEIVGRARAIKAWKNLIRSRSFFSVVIESLRPVAGQRIVAFGADAFVSRAFAEAEISNPRPGLNSRIIASVVSGASVILSEQEVRAANTRGGLDMVILCGSWRECVLNQPAISEVCTHLSASFLQLHRGYRIFRILTETVGEAEKRQYEATHAWRIIRSFDGPPEASRAFGIITREEALAVTGSFIGPLFHHREPVLQLRDADQRLLLTALDGLTDQELAVKLNLSLPAVKKRWISIFERTAAKTPDLFATCCDNDDGRQRGKQKRHHLLAYIRSHPEELRPVEPDRVGRFGFAGKPSTNCWC